jgi:hypothetical protein
MRFDRSTVACTIMKSMIVTSRTCSYFLILLVIRDGLMYDMISAYVTE